MADPRPNHPESPHYGGHYDIRDRSHPNRYPAPSQPSNNLHAPSQAANAPQPSPGHMRHYAEPPHQVHRGNLEAMQAHPQPTRYGQHRQPMQYHQPPVHAEHDDRFGSPSQPINYGPPRAGIAREASGNQYQEFPQQYEPRTTLSQNVGRNFSSPVSRGSSYLAMPHGVAPTALSSYVPASPDYRFHQEPTSNRVPNYSGPQADWQSGAGGSGAQYQQIREKSQHVSAEARHPPTHAQRHGELVAADRLNNHVQRHDGPVSTYSFDDHGPHRGRPSSDNHFDSRDPGRGRPSARNYSYNGGPRYWPQATLHEHEQIGYPAAPHYHGGHQSPFQRSTSRQANQVVNQPRTEPESFNDNAHRHSSHQDDRLFDPSFRNASEKSLVPASIQSEEAHRELARLEQVFKNEGDNGLERERATAEKTANESAMNAQKTEEEKHTLITKLEAKQDMATFAESMGADFTPDMITKVLNTVKKMRQTVAHIVPGSPKVDVQGSMGLAPNVTYTPSLVSVNQSGVDRIHGDDTGVRSASGTTGQVESVGHRHPPQEVGFLSLKGTKDESGPLHTGQTVQIGTANERHHLPNHDSVRNLNQRSNWNEYGSGPRQYTQPSANPPTQDNYMGDNQEGAYNGQQHTEVQPSATSWTQPTWQGQGPQHSPDLTQVANFNTNFNVSPGRATHENAQPMQPLSHDPWSGNNERLGFEGGVYAAESAIQPAPHATQADGCGDPDSRIGQTQTHQ